MAKLMVHRNILKNFHKLPSKVQKRVSELIEEFQRDPYSPSIGLHPLSETMLDPKVRGVKKLPDGYRAIVIAPDRGDTFLLVHVDSHDRTYEWAKNKRFEVHGVTGVFQVFDADEVREAARESTVSPQNIDEYPLSHLSDDELFTAGVPKPLIPAVKSVRSDEGLQALAEYLPPDCRDVLFGLAAGMTLEESLNEMLGAAPAPVESAPGSPGDFSKILASPNFDLLPIAGQEELKRILQGSLEEWRIFLHPYQRKLVTWSTTGPMSVTGSAGTGKTVALMHRAVYLARNLAADAGKILVTTFTSNLALTIRQNLERLAPDVAHSIDVVHLHSLAKTICDRAGWKGRIAEDDELAHVWEDVWSGMPDNVPLSRGELETEYRLIIDRNGIDDEEGYLSTVRTGRPRISREQRRQAWPVFRSFQRALKKRGLMTFEGAIHEARLAVQQGNFQRYTHVLVDEVQDFSLEALRLIGAMSPPAGTRDPLCLVGDGHQRIYGTKFPMSRAGIDIRGRSRRLKINYRTSEQIRRFAHGILKGVEIDDLDGGVTTTVGDHSVFKGPEPVVEKCKNEKAEAEAIVAWVQMLLNDYHFATHEICITPYRPAIRSALSSAEIATFELRPKEYDPGEKESGVRLGTMKRIKGLEFRAIAMACAGPADPMNDLENATLSDRCERYVAATRAREHLLITVSAK